MRRGKSPEPKQLLHALAYVATLSDSARLAPAMLQLRCISICALALVLCACSAASPLADAPEYDPEGQAKCAAMKSQSEPLIIEWPATQRAKLEAIASRHAIAVRYDGCEMEVIGACKIPRAYEYTPTTRQREHVSIKDEDELYARLPLGAAKLQANLEKAGELNVSMTIVGTFETDRSQIHRDELKGACGRATHIVDALIVGAFEFYAGAERRSAQAPRSATWVVEPRARPSAPCCGLLVRRRPARSPGTATRARPRVAVRCCAWRLPASLERGRARTWRHPSQRRPSVAPTSGRHVRDRQQQRRAPPQLRPGHPRRQARDQNPHMLPSSRLTPRVAAGLSRPRNRRGSGGPSVA